MKKIWVSFWSMFGFYKSNVEPNVSSAAPGAPAELVSYEIYVDGYPTNKYAVNSPSEKDAKELIMYWDKNLTADRIELRKSKITVPEIFSNCLMDSASLGIS